MFLKKTTQTINKTIGQSGININETQKLLQQQIQGLKDFTTKEVPQMKETQKELIASMEQLAQTARALIKK